MVSNIEKITVNGNEATRVIGTQSSNSKVYVTIRPAGSKFSGKQWQVIVDNTGEKEIVKASPECRNFFGDELVTQVENFKKDYEALNA